MAARVKKIRHDDETRFYVYAVECDGLVVYVGKGAGKRAAASARRFGGAVKILERMNDEDYAFERERHWIAALQPSENKCSGGNGGRAGPINPIPKSLRGRVTLTDMRRAERDYAETVTGIKRLGARRYVARLMLSFFANCPSYAKGRDINAIRAVAA